MKISAQMTVVMSAIFAVVCFAVAITGFLSLGEIADATQMADATGFAWFWKRHAEGRAVEPAVLVMVLAGFIKHNFIALPLVALLWWARSRARRLLMAHLLREREEA